MSSDKDYDDDTANRYAAAVAAVAAAASDAAAANDAAAAANAVAARMTRAEMLAAVEATVTLALGRNPDMRYADTIKDVVTRAAAFGWDSRR